MCVPQVNGKVFRIGHLGNMDELMMCSAISGAEMAMRDAGAWVDTGSATLGMQRGQQQAVGAG
jgi:aspartate aminotransferase-like enzyme